MSQILPRWSHPPNGGFAISSEAKLRPSSAHEGISAVRKWRPLIPEISVGVILFMARRLTFGTAHGDKEFRKFLVPSGERLQAVIYLKTGSGTWQNSMEGEERQCRPPWTWVTRHCSTCETSGEVGPLTIMHIVLLFVTRCACCCLPTLPTPRCDLLSHNNIRRPLRTDFCR